MDNTTGQAQQAMQAKPLRPQKSRAVKKGDSALVPENKTAKTRAEERGNATPAEKPARKKAVKKTAPVQENWPFPLGVRP